MKKFILRNAVLFCTGFCIYITVECLFRGYSFPLMGVVGGLAMIIVSYINDIISWDLPLISQCAIGGAVITAMEYFVGIADRLILHIHMWDYSNLPCSDSYGVINLFFFFIWCVLAAVGIILSDCITYYMLHDEQRPYYRSLTGNILFMLPTRECNPKYPDKAW